MRTEVKFRDGVRAVVFISVLFLCLPVEQTRTDGLFKKAAVTANGKPCAAIGAQIMARGGSVADACIAAMLCDGIASAERMGIGGGFTLLHYSRANRKTEVLLSREVAPLRATRDMYSKNKAASLFGGLAVAVPGELRGYWELHRRHGRLPWADLLQPAIQMCEEGVEAGPFVTKCLNEYEANVMSSPSLRAIFGNFCQSFSGGRPKIFRQQLARTLRLVAKHGPNVLYDGTLTESFLEDIKKHGGFISREDLRFYQYPNTALL